MNPTANAIFDNQSPMISFEDVSDTLILDDVEIRLERAQEQ